MTPSEMRSHIANEITKQLITHKDMGADDTPDIYDDEEPVDIDDFTDALTHLESVEHLLNQLLIHATMAPGRKMHLTRTIKELGEFNAQFILPDKEEI